MPAPFIDYFPTNKDFERLRLMLSTFQDGSGMLNPGGTGTLPGWRDFERSVAAFVGGKATESKHIFDVALEGSNEGQYYGYSCKMRSTLRDSERLNDATIEVTNSNSKLWDGLRAQGIDENNIADSDPFVVGTSLVSTIESWYQAVNITQGGSFLVDESPMLHLAYELKNRRYQLFCFPKHLPLVNELHTLDWQVLAKQIKGTRPDGSRCFEWFKGSGGQVKYYPKLDDANWRSDVFYLEALPDTGSQVNILVEKASLYFGDLWEEASEDS